MRIALVGRFAACAALLTLGAFSRFEDSACASDGREAPSSSNVCPAAAYLATAPQAENNCAPCEQQVERGTHRLGLFSRWRFMVRNREAAVEVAPPLATRPFAEINAACAEGSRACAEACERTVNFEEPIENAAECQACQCRESENAACACSECACCESETDRCAAEACTDSECACVCHDAECAACACQESENAICACSECACCESEAERCVAEACVDSECACICHDSQCAAGECCDAACAAGACGNAECVAGECCDAACAGCVSGEATCPACADVCGGACCEPSAEQLPAAPAAGVQGEPSPDEVASEILELMQRLGPSALDGTEFAFPEVESPDPAAAEAARAAMREHLASLLRGMAEQHLAQQQAMAAQQPVFVMPAPEFEDVMVLQRACHNLDVTAQLLEEQHLFDAADQVREVAAQLRQTARSLGEQSAEHREPARATSTRSARRPGAPGRTVVDRFRPMLQSGRSSNRR